MELIKTTIMTETYLVKDYPNHPMFVMIVNLDVVVEKKDILIMLEKVSIEPQLLKKVKLLIIYILIILIF